MKLTEEQHAQIDAFIEELSTINDVEWYLDPCGHIRCVLGSGNDVEWYLETCGKGGRVSSGRSKKYFFGLS